MIGDGIASLIFVAGVAVMMMMMCLCLCWQCAGFWHNVKDTSSDDWRIRLNFELLFEGTYVAPLSPVVSLWMLLVDAN